jgi:hypothetical protein
MRYKTAISYVRMSRKIICFMIEFQTICEILDQTCSWRRTMLKIAISGKQLKRRGMPAQPMPREMKTFVLCVLINPAAILDQSFPQNCSRNFLLAIFPEPVLGNSG